MATDDVANDSATTTGPAAWTVRHFSQANPRGHGQDDVPALLRRVATTIAGLGPIDVQDIVLHTEVTAEGPWYSITVYYHQRSDT